MAILLWLIDRSPGWATWAPISMENVCGILLGQMSYHSPLLSVIIALVLIFFCSMSFFPPLRLYILWGEIPLGSLLSLGVYRH